MCRIRFHPDGIYLSFLYIEKVEEPDLPLQKAYHKRSGSPLPCAVIEKQISRKDVPKKVDRKAKNRKDKPRKVKEDSLKSKTISSPSPDSDGEEVQHTPATESQSSSSSSSSSVSSSSSSSPSPSSNVEDPKQNAVEQSEIVKKQSKSGNGKQKIAVQAKNTKKSKNNAKASKVQFVTPTSTEADEHSTPGDSEESKESSPAKQVRFSDTPSPPKQVRFSEVVGKREIPSEDDSESSSSTDSSHESSIDEQAHKWLQGEIEPEPPTVSQAPASTGSTDESHDISDGSATSNAESEGSTGSNLSRFQLQKTLSPLSRIHRPSLKRLRKALHEPTFIIQSRIENQAKSGSNSAPDLRRSKEGSGNLRNKFMKEGHALKSAIKKGKENHQPVHVSEEDEDSEIEVDEETGMTWRDA